MGERARIVEQIGSGSELHRWEPREDGCRISIKAGAKAT
jgi:hypothetical protein